MEPNKQTSSTNANVIDPLKAQRKRALFAYELNEHLIKFFNSYIFQFKNSQYLSEMQLLKEKIRGTHSQLAGEIDKMIQAVSTLTLACSGGNPIVTAVTAAITTLSAASVKIKKILDEKEVLKDKRKSLRKMLNATYVMQFLLPYFPHQDKPASEMLNTYFDLATQNLTDHITARLYLRFAAVIFQLDHSSIQKLANFFNDCIINNVFDSGNLGGKPIDIFLRATYPAEYDGDFTYKIGWHRTRYYHLLQDEFGRAQAIAKLFYWAKRVDIAIDTTSNVLNEVTCWGVSESSKQKEVSNFPAIIQGITINNIDYCSFLKHPTGFSQLSNSNNKYLDNVVKHDIHEIIKKLQEIEKNIGQQTVKKIAEIMSTESQPEILSTSSSSQSQAKQPFEIAAYPITENAALLSDSDESDEEQETLDAKLNHLISLQGYFSNSANRAQHRIDSVRDKLLRKKIASDYSRLFAPASIQAQAQIPVIESINGK